MSSKINYILVLLCILTCTKNHAQSLEKVTERDASFYKVEGDSLFELGDYNRAITAYKKASKTTDILFKIAKSYETLGFSKQALAQYEMALDQEPDNLFVHYNYGKLLYSFGNIIAAKPVFASLANKQPENPNYPYYQGLIAEKENENDTLAITYYKEALHKDADHLNSVYRVAKLFTEKRKFNKARAYIDQGLAVDETSKRFLTLKALSAYYQDEFHDAILNFKQLIALGHGDEQFWEKVAISYAKTYQYQLAIDAFEKLVTDYDPKNASYFYNLGKCLMGLEKFEQGRINIEMSIALKSPALDNEYVSIAASYNREQNYKETIAFLKKAIKENPNNEYAHYQLAVAADNYYKDDNEVLKYYERYLDYFKEKGDFYQLALTRSNDLKEKIHMSTDK